MSRNWQLLLPLRYCMDAMHATCGFVVASLPAALLAFAQMMALERLSQLSAALRSRPLAREEIKAFKQPVVLSLLAALLLSLLR